MTKLSLFFSLSSLILVTSILLGCQIGIPTNSSPDLGTGVIFITANGEEFVRDGFTSKDGWDIYFDHLYVNLDNINAYQTDPPYDASTGANPENNAKAASAVSGDFRIDLTQDRESGEAVFVHSISANIGQYNAVQWEMPATDEGTIQLIGTASKEGETIGFDIGITDTFAYSCGEYVGDVRKGFVTNTAVGEVELTFHLDHLFGDADSPADDALNVGALGFQPLANLATDSNLALTTPDLQAQLSPQDYATFQEMLGTLGHVGEGHCYESTTGYTGDES